MLDLTQQVSGAGPVGAVGWQWCPESWGGGQGLGLRYNFGCISGELGHGGKGKKRHMRSVGSVVQRQGRMHPQHILHNAWKHAPKST